MARPCSRNPWPKTQLDRFLLKINFGYPNRNQEIAILDLFQENDPLEDLQPDRLGHLAGSLCNPSISMYIHCCSWNCSTSVVILDLSYWPDYVNL
ncbi:MAG: hypothetical protein K9K64_16045 [Desulfohalobiaceae bacterium]|nr:hypothetical protein [Desulfohalobiaceae bacterium]